METTQSPHCTSDQRLHALVSEMKSILSPQVLENGAVLVALLPKHRCCCAGSCHGVEPRENKETGKNKGTQESRHSLEGMWVSGSGLSTILIHTVPGKEGYLFGTEMFRESTLSADHVIFWFKTGAGISNKVLEGIVQNRKGVSRVSIHSFIHSFVLIFCFPPFGLIFLVGKLRLCTDDTFDLMWADESGVSRYKRWQPTHTSEVVVA